MRSRSRAVTARLAVAVLGGVLLAIAGGAAAVGLPAGGAGPDTPGTSSSVSPSTLAPGDWISFTVNGFPAGETVYIKIDDGVGYGDTTVQGSGVIHKQAINSRGTASGSFQLPADIAPGAHWLRYLASAYVDPSDPNKGVLGYTNRGGSDFTVVASSIGGASRGGSAPAKGATVGEGAAQAGGQGAVIAIDPNLVASAAPEPTSATSAEPSPEATAMETRAAVESAVQEESGVPILGIVVGGAIVLAGAGVTTWLLRRGTRTQ